MKKFLLPALLLPLLCACDDSDQDTHDPTVYNIVELEGRDQDGTTFRYYPAPGNTPVILQAKSQSATSLQPGDCLFMGYTVNATDNNRENNPGGQQDPGEAPLSITVKSMAAVLNTDVRVADPAEIQGWDAEPINLLSLWRAGEKIILRCLLTADAEPRYFGLLVDSSTLSEPVPTAYVYHRRKNPIPNYSSQYYTAFSLTPLLHPDGPEPDFKALRIKIANADNPSRDEFIISLE